MSHINARSCGERSVFTAQLNRIRMAARWPANAALAWSLLAVPLMAQTAYAAQNPPGDVGQASNGRVMGVVQNTQGHLQAGILVRVSDAAGQIVATTTTDRVGAFAFESLPAGSYQIDALAQGKSVAHQALLVEAGGNSPVKLVSSTELGAVTVTARREVARNALSASTGSSQYSFDAKAINALPEGENTPLNQVLLQAPGVVNNSYGQIHIRGDHGDIQYRINGIILPEGVASFGETLDTRFANKIDLLTGALPAQYGYRTAGVVDIVTKQGIHDGGVVGVYGGSHDTINPSFQLGGEKGPWSGFLSGSYYSSELGIEAPTDAYEPIHDRTTQGKGFGYLAYQLAPRTKLSVIMGTSVNRFEIPNNPNQVADAGYLDAMQSAGLDTSTITSTGLDERQLEHNNYALVALQGTTTEGIGYQTAIYNRISAVNYMPDQLGDLAFNGDASTIKRKSSTVGLQSDLKIPLSETHTLRTGFTASTEDDRADNTSTVFQTVNANADGSCPSGSSASDSGSCVTTPVTIVDNNPKNGNTLMGLYVQDQWDLTDRLTINYGLRYDVLNAYVNAQQLSPRLGMIWYVDEATTVHAGYARYFTPPPNELVAGASLAKFANTTNAPEVTTNDPVLAERDHYFDIGASRQFGKSFTVGLDTFYKYARNLLDEGQFGSALIYTPFNYQQGHIYGAELSTSYHRGNWSAYYNLAHTVAQATGVASGQFNFSQADLDYINQHYIYLDHDQHWTMSGGTSYVLYRTTLSATATWGDGLRNDGDGSIPNGGKEPTNMQVDLAVSRPIDLPGFGPLDVRLAAINVLDRKNQIHDGSGVGVFAAQYGPRAAVYLGLSKSFGI